MPRKILIVDDVVINRQMLGEALDGDYEILEAAGGAEALELLRGGRAEVSAVLLDIVMPGMDGYETLSRIRDDAQLTQLPVIMVTGFADEEARKRSLALGADDFVTKPFNPDVIRHCLHNNIALRETLATVSALRRDRLTGLYSRETFFEIARDMILKQAPGYYTMACFDIDKFKVINDQYGTRKGDEVLKYIARVFEEGFGAHGGICCRVASDDFAVLYPAGFQSSDELAQLRKKAAEIDGLVAPITFCIGRYAVNDINMPPSAMYDRAVLAAASVKGRYDVKIANYDESMRDHLIYEQQVVTEMESALAGRQFEAWFQPQYNHSTGALIGAEALVRWRHPQKGLIPPGLFIPIFEQNGFVYELDKFVWEESCRYLRKWLDEGVQPLSVSVNISRYDIFRHDLVPVLTGLIEKYRLPVELLRLEITESAFAKSTEQIVKIVKQLIGYGFTVEIDDFGSGYSSLNTLKDVPAQILKLDMKFLQSSSNSQRGGNIVESIVRMAKWLGMSVIAEGVETMEQADYLRSIGCNYLQGYLYARPMPGADYEALFEGAGKEERLLALETVENLDNNSFWDPASMDTLIFNSYVGGACIYEYHKGNIELLRATEKYAQVIGSAGMTVEDALKLNWEEHLDENYSRRVIEDLETSITTRGEVTGEYIFLDLPGCPHETYLRSSMRVIAAAGDRYLVYCTNENITAQRKAEQRERRVAEQMQAIMDDIGSGITAAVLKDGREELLFSNERFYQIHGCTRERYEKENMDRFALIHPDDRNRAHAATMEAYASRKPAQLEYRLALPGDNVRWVRVGLSSTRFTGIDENVHLCIFSDITDEKKSEQQLRDTTAQLQTMMNDIPGGFARLRVLKDVRTLPMYINEGLQRLTGMEHGQLMHMYSHDALAGVHPDDLPLVREAVSRMLKKGEAHSSRYRLACADGGYIWLSIFGRMTKDEAGNAYLNIYYTDATEQVRAEEQQKELLDNLPYGAALYEYDGETLEAVHLNKRYWKLVDREAPENESISFMDAVHPDDADIIQRELSAATRQKRDAACDIRVRCGEHGYRPFHVAGRIVPRDDGKYSIYAAYTPISDEEMSYQKMLPVVLSTIMESTTDLSFAKDMDFRYICASFAFTRMVGLECENDVIGKTDYDIFDKDLADKYRRDDEALIASGESIINMIESIPSPDGVPRYSSTSKHLLRDADGKLIGLYGVGRDITAYRDAFEKLKFITDNIPGGIATYEYSQDGTRLLYFNDGYCQLFGLTREEFEQNGESDPGKWVFEEYQPDFQAQLRALVKHGTPADCIYKTRTAAGGYKWICLKAVASDRSEGKVIINAMLQDVTEQREITEKLRLSEEENKLAIQMGGNIVCRYLISDRSLTMAPETAHSIDLPAEIRDVPYEPARLGMIAPESVVAYTAFFEDILRGGKAGSVVFQQRYLEKWRWMEAKSRTVFSNAGEPVKAVISFLDVTERLEKETVYKKWQQSLEEKRPDSYTLFRCNLSKGGSYDTMEGTLLNVKFGEAELGFDERTLEYVDQCVFEQDKEKYIAFLNSDSMLANYYRGKRSDALEYRELLHNESTRWLRLSVEMVEYPNSSDVEAYLMYENIDDAKRAELQTKELAELDPLTGVLNRSTFASMAEQAMRAAPDARHALLMLDIDGFKQVNDVFGHKAGDLALMDIADSLRFVLRPGDLLGRLGGDEFLVFLNNITDDELAAGKARQMCAAARKALSLEVQISGSVGIVVTPRDGADFETLYKKVDSALYHVKGSGKDNFIFYRDDMENEHLKPEEDQKNGKKLEKKRRMLIVDDNALDHAFLTSIFSDEFIIEKANNGNTALIRLRHYGTSISVVLLDLVMPGMNGFAVLEKMRAAPELQSIPVIIVSGDESRETCLQTIRNGATDFITKPVDPELLRIRVRSAVSKAENERLRAKNNYLELRNSERMRYETALEGAGIAVVEYDWLSGDFVYYPSTSKYVAGNYDKRKLWHILLSDMVADTFTVQKMQNLVHNVADDRARLSGSVNIKLKTPEKCTHHFRMNVRKLINEYQLTHKLIITLLDVDLKM